MDFLSPYFTEIHMPLGVIKNKKGQKNNVPEKIEIFEDLSQKSINDAIDEGVSSIWVADKNKLITFE
ncbi:hypothetical protein [Picosynechococcus sp. PCC 8807]|uniref:hypothetical protein n=1 Tax=Picosynechococcus sp. PCC 8807 TaxID=195248 RepID=UPI0018DDB1DD|nr:hypothetical protein [Picosynechococcus sp. PCC 8807]